MIRRPVEDPGARRHGDDVEDARGLRGRVPLVVVLILELVCGAALAFAACQA